jgi:hypothetical protein
MNILILTPDRVGSTLLQRFITVKMQFEQYEKPVVNLHELTNGIIKSDSTGLLCKPAGGPTNWTYFQTLPEIINLLSSTDHYVTARLAKYHINNRKDSLQDQLSLYEYLNNNFYIISCHRTNLFEHAISWSFYAYSKKLNAFSHDEKQEIYKKLTANHLYIDPKILTKHLDAYVNYEKWVDTHFQVNATYNYEIDSRDLESYCNKLNIFSDNSSWERNYGISWDNFNRCHYGHSDTSNITLQLANLANSRQVPLLSNIRDNVLPVETEKNYQLIDQEFLQKHNANYAICQDNIASLVSQNIIPNGIPIKLQTLAEKYNLIQNFDECLEAYNLWAMKNNAPNYTKIDLANQAIDELKYWYNVR